jgi:pyrimidine nucleoside transport protein
MTEGDSTEAVERKKLGSDFDHEVSKAFLASPEKVPEKTHDVLIPNDHVTSYLPEPEADDDWFDSDDDVDLEKKKSNLVAKCVITLQESVKWSIFMLTKITKGYLVSVVLLIGFSVYFILAMNYEFGSESSIRLLVCTILGVVIATRSYVYLAYRWTFKKVYGAEHLSALHQKRVALVRFVIRWVLYAVLAAVTIWVLVDQGKKDLINLRSLPGLLLFLIFCTLLSTHPGKINWHTIYWSFELQFLAALFVLKWKFGKEVILWIQERLDEFFANSEEGAKLMFGETYKDHYMVFGALPIVFITNATLTILYYLGAMQFIIGVIGNFLSFVLDTSPVESMSVAAGIFLEGIAAILTLRPFLPVMTKSQLFLVITSVFASLGGAYLAILSSLGVSLEYLIPAMLVSAPATFAVCKLIVPETHNKQGNSVMDNLHLADDERNKYANILDAAQTGASSMLALVGNIITVAFAFFSYISWINKTLNWFGDRVGIDNLSIELISSYLLYPVALMMGIEPDDCRNVAMLLGYRIGVNNIIAFFKLTDLKINKAKFEHYMMVTNGTGPVYHSRDDVILGLWNETLKNGFITERSEAIVTYCLCGFSSFLTVAITIGIMFTLVPNRKVWIAKVSMACLIAGNVANCMTGCFASLFY